MIKWSILILSLPNRLDMLKELYSKLTAQIGDRKDIEVLTIVDNRSMTVGEKRNMALSLARGEYLSFLDDDDTVSDNYVNQIYNALNSNPDVVTFDQHCSVNGIEFNVSFGLKNPNEPAILQNGRYKDIRRKPYHMCVWRSVIAKNTPFQTISYGEDIDWIMKLSMRSKTETHINEVLHYYNYTDNQSETLKFRK